MPAAERAGFVGRAGLGLVALSVALVVLTGLLGPSAAQPPLAVTTPRRAHPPYWLDTTPSAWLVSGLLAAALVAGALAVGAACWALRRGWGPDPRRLLVAGALAVLALVLVPPMGSADHLSYAAYGRIAAAGEDPYAVAPDKWRGGHDPVAGAVERPWRWAPSVYGPLTTLTQRGASTLAGPIVHTTVLLLSLLAAAAFLATGLLLHRLARGTPGGQARAALLWTLNPLLLYEVVAGAHVDALAVALGVAAVAAARRSAVGGGVLVGAAVLVKLPMALYAVAFGWALRHRRRQLLSMGAAALAVAIPAYVAAGPHVLDQLRRASTYVALATPWRLVLGDLEAGLGHDDARRLVGRLGLAVGAVLVLALTRAGPRGADPGARAAFVLTAGWLLAAPYALPWYDAALWAPLVLLPASRLDLLVLARGLVLALAYVPGRVVGLPAGLRDVTLALRAQWTPWLLLVVAAVVLLAAVLPSGGSHPFAGRR